MKILILMAGLILATLQTATEPIFHFTQAQSRQLMNDPDKYNEAVIEIYLDAIKNQDKYEFYMNGSPVEIFDEEYGYNHFAICDVDCDGYLELIISCTETFVAGMWGNVYQYDFKLEKLHDEGLTEPDITFYDNGVAYEPWRHNQGYGEMWPYEAFKYDPQWDRYEQVLNVDSWDKVWHEEGFPDEIDTDGAGTVYYVSTKEPFYVDGDPVSKSEYDRIAGQYFDGAKEIEVTYYEISDEGIENYLKENE